MNATALVPAAPAVLSEEDLARVRWYRFLAGVFQAAPDAAMLASIAAAAGATARDVPDRASEPPLLRAWADLAVAARAATTQTVREEHDRVFVSVGKAPVLLNASYYLSGFLNERPLVELRDTLSGLGLARRGDIGETEDHLASLCEAMALLIESDDPLRSQASTQRDFFQRFVSPWYERLADSIDGCDDVQFYRPVARLMRCFFDVERQAFDFDA